MKELEHYKELLDEPAESDAIVTPDFAVSQMYGLFYFHTRLSSAPLCRFAARKVHNL
jgi:hypothetical protein